MKFETDNFYGELWAVEDTNETRGYFEHKKWGDEYGGGLWFEDKQLVDYDGVADLPDEVWDKLEESGYEVYVM